MNYSAFLFFSQLLDGLEVRLRKTHGKWALTQVSSKIIGLLDRELERFGNIERKKLFWPLFQTQTESRKVILELRAIFEEEQLDQVGAKTLIRKRLKEIRKDIQKYKTQKIRAVFFANEACAWNSLDSVWRAFSEDPQIETRLVYLPFNHIDKNDTMNDLLWYEKNGYPVIQSRDYNLSEDSPDVVFYLKPYDSIPKEFYIDTVAEYIKRVVFIPYGFEVAGGEEILTYQFRLPLQYKAWKIVGYSNHYKEMAKKFGYRGGENVAVLGHPRLDKVDSSDRSRRAIPGEWTEKIRGRKVILWNTHFSIMPGYGWGTFLQWKEFIFDYFKKQEEFVLLWRPHPLLFGALKERKIYSSKELDDLKEYVQKNENMILDENEDYLTSFYAADALITDGTSFLLEYLPYGKPILYTPKTNGWGLSDPEIVKGYYIAREEKDFEEFFYFVRTNQDPNREERRETSLKYLLQPNGNIGEHVKEYIIREIEKEEVENAKDFLT